LSARPYWHVLGCMSLGDVHASMAEGADSIAIESFELLKTVHDAHKSSTPLLRAPLQLVLPEALIMLPAALTSAVPSALPGLQLCVEFAGSCSAALLEKWRPHIYPRVTQLPVLQAAVRNAQFDYLRVDMPIDRDVARAVREMPPTVHVTITTSAHAICAALAAIGAAPFAWAVDFRDLSAARALTAY
jgi:hypothetical protein